MKIKILIIVCLIHWGNSFSQNRYSTTSTSTYQPMSYEQISSVARYKQGQNKNNQELLYSLKSWILELKPQIYNDIFVQRLNKVYNDLTKMEHDDLSEYDQLFKQVEMVVKEIISDYNIFVSKQNSQQSTTQNLSGNQTPPENQTPPNTQESKTHEVEDFLNEGAKYYENEDYSKAIFSFSKYLENNPNNTDVIFYRALSKSAIDDRYGAISDYEKILSMEGKVTPKNYKFSTVYNNKAYCLVELGNYKEALPFVEKALQLDKTEWYIWDTRAEIFLNLGELDKCISDCTKAIKIKKNGNSYLVRGLAYI